MRAATLLVVALVVGTAADDMHPPPSTVSDLLVVFPGWACEARAYSTLVAAAGFGEAPHGRAADGHPAGEALYLPLYDSAATLNEWLTAKAGGLPFIEALSARTDAWIDREIGARLDSPADGGAKARGARKLVLFGHSAGSLVARRAANRWASRVRALVYYGGLFQDAAQQPRPAPYPFLAMHGGANLASRDGASQVAQALDFARTATAAAAAAANHSAPPRARTAFLLLRGATHFSCAARDAISRSNRWQAYSGMAPLAQPDVDRQAEIGALVGAFARAAPADAAWADGEAAAAEWASAAAPAAESAWLAATWATAAGEASAPAVELHASVEAFEAAIAPRTLHALQPRGALGEWWLKRIGAAGAGADGSGGNGIPREGDAVSGRALNAQAWAWAVAHAGALVAGGRINATAPAAPPLSPSARDAADAAARAVGAAFLLDDARIEGNLSEALTGQRASRAGALAAWRAAPAPAFPRLRSPSLWLLPPSGAADSPDADAAGSATLPGRVGAEAAPGPPPVEMAQRFLKVVGRAQAVAYILGPHDV